MTNVLEYLENTLAANTATHHKPAFISGDDMLTFGQLYDNARAIGSYLCNQCVSKQPIAVFMQKSPAMIAAFMGVAYGGSYYVPLDIDMPAFRIKLVLETVNPPIIICDEATQKLMAEWEPGRKTVLFSDITQYPVSDMALAQVRQSAIDTDPLYVVFTSGSTGTPKGVIASHRSVIDYVDNLSNILHAGSDTIFGMQSPLYLDACLKEIFPTLKYGATTHIVPPSLFMFPVRLIEFLNQHKINTICWVASALGLVAGLGALDKSIPDTLHTIAFTSEVLPIKHFNRWREVLPNARFIHLYGPTEATGVSTFYEAKGPYGADEAIPIGRPFPNSDIILLDDNNAQPPHGQPGEICIRGGCLSLGYFGDPDKTQAAFVQNPLVPFPDRIYKTGDLGYVGANGQLYFISRRDRQIKHMGYRIELAEIEWVAAKCADIDLACVIFDHDKSRIIMYYTAKDGAAKPQITAYLKANLPRYMMPHTIYPIDSMPLTPGGKFDRAGLLAIYKEEK